MQVLDNKLTSDIQEWLNTPSESRDIIRGAEMMLSLNRNRALFNSVLRNPKKFSAKLEYELRKFLKIRLMKLSTADVARIEEAVLPSVQETVDSLPADPSGQEGSGVQDAPVLQSEDEIAPRRRGKRDDHDSLPEEVRRLWDDNILRGRRIVLLFNECKAMADALPCDRFEKVNMLGKLDRDYRMSMQMYDDYVPGMPFSGFSETPSEDAAKAVNSARKMISTYKGKLSALAAGDDEKRSRYLEKIEEAARTVIANGGAFTPDYAEELRSMGADIPR